MNALKREWWFLSRDKSAVFWLVIAFACACLAIGFGLQEVQTQRNTIARLKHADAIEQQVMSEAHRDWGSAAYYTFHLTYDEPSDFAFIALGHRDLQPWKHRIRMLALEGQIYEADAQNPDFALVGRFDYAFLVAVLLPLFVIFLLYDLRTRERANGRFELLDSTNSGVWIQRSMLRLVLLCLAFLVPLWVVSVSQAVAFTKVGYATLTVILYAVFWWVVVNWITRREYTGALALTALMGTWFAVAILIPAGLKLAIDHAVTIPNNGELLLTQREAVNDAWDIPVNETMDPFVARHPEWADYTSMQGTFEWKWYYAFQQVGDQTVEPISMAYRQGRQRRDQLASAWSWLAPSAKVERIFQAIANTDASSYYQYENRIRQFHEKLRHYYYPHLFKDTEFNEEALKLRPDYSKVSAKTTDLVK